MSNFGKSTTAIKLSVHDRARIYAWSRDICPSTMNSLKGKFLRDYEKKYGPVVGQKVSDCDLEDNNW
jgi:hypothetical protein